MKLEEMQKICDEAQKNKGCIGCKLFSTLIKNGCLKNHRYDIVEQYKKFKAENNKIMALKTMNDYKELEGKVMKDK